MALSLSERFWAKVDRSGGPEACWPWTAGTTRSSSKTPRAYGQIRVDGHQKRSHRVAYELTYGPVPDGLFVCHSCDNPPCCNPAHLWAGTNTDNMRDMKAKGRSTAKQLDANLVVVMRARGMDFTAIGAELNVSRQTARRTFQRAMKARSAPMQLWEAA